MAENKSSYVRTRIANEMDQYTDAVAKRIDSTVEIVLQYMFHTIIAAVVDRLASEYYLEPRFWEYLSEKEDILSYLCEEVKELGFQMSDSAIADGLMDLIYSDIDHAKQN